MAFHMSYHLLNALFTAVCKDCHRDLLTNGLGGRIITMLSVDLDLTVSRPVSSLCNLSLIDLFCRMSQTNASWLMC